MKAIILSTLFALLFVSAADAQCNSDAILSDCNGKLSGFTFIKDYKIDPSKANNGVLEFSYVFSKETQYFLTVCDGKSNNPKIEVTLLDANRKVLSSNKDNGTYYSGIAYKCTTTGIYYMSFNISEASEKCAVSALGFKK